jgi:hypothetical protein
MCNAVRHGLTPYEVHSPFLATILYREVVPHGKLQLSRGHHLSDDTQCDSCQRFVSASSGHYTQELPGLPWEMTLWLRLLTEPSLQIYERKFRSPVKYIRRFAQDGTLPVEPTLLLLGNPFRHTLLDLLMWNTFTLIQFPKT